MKYRLLLRLAGLFAILAFAAACHDDPYITLKSSKEMEVASSGSPVVISFSTNCPWTVESSADWCTPDMLSGDGDKAISLTLTCTPNSDHNPRGCHVTVTTDAGSLTVKLTQLPALMLIPSQEAVTIGWKECNFTVDVQFNTPYTVSIIDGGEWLAVGTTRTLYGAQESFIATVNESLDARTATIRFDAEGIDPIIVQVQQEGYTHPILNDFEPGFYGFGYDLAYTPGRDQTCIVRKQSGLSYRILNPSAGSVGELDGLPIDADAGQQFDGSVTIVRGTSLIYSADSPMKIVKALDDLLWIVLDDEKGIIARI